MTKKKTKNKLAKFGHKLAVNKIPKYCYNCKYGEFPYDIYDSDSGIYYTEYTCRLVNKKYHAEYSCKKWRIQE